MNTPAPAHGLGTGIAKLTVYHLARLIFTGSALTGEQLEGRPDTEKFESTDRALIDEVLARIERAQPKPSDAGCDARWGLIFTNASDERVRTLYLDQFGTSGVLDGAKVTLSDESLIEWLRERYGPDSVLA
jgi:hypothetical protein